MRALTESGHRMRERVNDAIRCAFEAHRERDASNPLLAVGDYLLQTRGKMLRGILLLDSCRAVGGDPDSVMLAAAGTEYGHLASLVHDDLIDRDDRRRGRRSVWREYGADLAVLSGDLLIFQAYRCLAMCGDTVPPERVVRVLDVLSAGCIDMCLGQALETELTGNCGATPAQYLDVARYKTASLFRTAVESGAILGGGTGEQIAAVRRFAEDVGIAYQMVDDILPYTTEADKLEKSGDSDLRNRRVTLPVIYALEAGNEPERRALLKAFGAGPDASDAATTHAEVTAILTQSGALDRIADEVQCLHQVALGHLEELPHNEGRASLAQLSQSLVGRRT